MPQLRGTPQHRAIARKDHLRLLRLRVELTTGSSGFPMARLVSIGQDTSFIARTQAVERLRKQLEALEKKQRGLKDRVALPFLFISEKVMIRFYLLSAVISGIIFFTADKKGFFIVPPLLVWVLFVLINTVRRMQHTAKLKDLWQTYGPKLEALEQEIFAKQAQIEKLENDLDTIAMSL